MRDDIHKGGRPRKQRPKAFYDALLHEYESMTIAQMAEAHSVTRTTISRWLKYARTGKHYGE